MGRPTSEKFIKSANYYVHGIDPQGYPIYKYWQFANLIRARIRIHTQTLKKRKARAKKDRSGFYKKDSIRLLTELEDILRKKIS